ncbi:MAG: chromosomal replication initiator protein DnaA [Actinomycetota bacterium]
MRPPDAIDEPRLASLDPAGEGPSGGPTEDPEGIWETAAVELRRHLSGNFPAWFAGVVPLSLERDTMVLSVPNRFTKEWIESKYLDLLRTVLSDCATRTLDVVVLARPETPGSDSASLAEPVQEDPAQAAAAAPPPAADFHPKYTFDLFVIGSSNRFAHAAALAVAEGPAQAYNPLFIYGDAGLGKTHLLHAIGHYAAEFHPGLVIRYVSTERFMNEFIYAIQHKVIPDFHRRYRAADLLLIDDIQFLEGKERTQEEFFHTFNSLHPRSQIVMTSDRPPKKISTLEQRLRTRFEWGLITDIQPPDLETRLAILQKKAGTDRLAVPPDVMSFIASRIQTNIRELEGALIRVAAYASLNQCEVTVELAQQVLQSLLPDSAEARVTSDLVIAVASEYFAVTPEEICSPNRSRPLVNARQMAMYLCRELTDLSLPRIGKRFGGRDHSTVVHANNKIKDLMLEKQSVYEQVRELTTRIRQQAARG